MMRIFDSRDSRNYRIKDLRVVYHNIPNKKGKMKAVKCVEYTVIGKNHEWPFWMSYKEFKLSNFHIEI